MKGLWFYDNYCLRGNISCLYRRDCESGADNVTKTNVIINGEQPGDSGDPELSEEPHNVPTNHTNHVFAETFSLTKSPYLAAALALGY